MAQLFLQSAGGFCQLSRHRLSNKVRICVGETVSFMDEEAGGETSFFPPLRSDAFVRLRAHVYLPLSLPAGPSRAEPSRKCTFLRLCANEGARAPRSCMAAWTACAPLVRVCSCAFLCGFLFIYFYFFW